MYKYKAQVVKIVDGDTVDFDVDLGFYMTAKIRTRLQDIDTPEIRGEERPQGLEAKMFVSYCLTDADIIIETTKTGKYGRWLATIFFKPREPDELLLAEALEGEYYNLNRLLLLKGLATEYK
jgi:micrococcal nuclease